MKVVFLASDKPREHMLAEAMGAGIKACGDDFEIRRTADYGEDCKYEGPSPDTDFAICFGVKGKSRQIIEDHLAMGRMTLNLDKGMSRQKGEGGHTEFSRIAINAKAPIDIMRANFDDSRLRSLGMRFDKRRSNGGHILICGSSEKYHEYHRLPAPDAWADKLIRGLRATTGRQIIYRPKPSDKRAMPVANASISTGSTPLSEALRGAHAMVTHGSSAGIQAILSGVPTWALGQNIMTPVAPFEQDNIEDLFWPSDSLRQSWACAVSFYQWRTSELRSGDAWKWIRAEANRLARRKKK